MNYKSVDIFVVIALTIIAVALAFTVAPVNVLGRILTLPLVLVLPGYALVAAMFPKQALGGAERAVFSLGLSLVIVILGGLVLNWTPFGLQAASWAVFLSGISLGACAVTLVRRRGQSISTSGWLWAGNIGLTFRQGLLLGLAAVIVCGAVAVSIIGAERQSYAGFTQLWILPAGGASAEDAVRLGVSNMESTAMEYRLAVNVNGKVVKEWPSIDLNPNEKWEATLVLPLTASAGDARVEADLYRTDVPTTIYRHVVLWLGT
ncbi:MAG: DUF1616 domain-containing protein [Ktedonobacteraceae bacterium]